MNEYLLSSHNPFYSPRCNDEELPPDLQEFSDDEQESKVLLKVAQNRYYSIGLSGTAEEENWRWERHCGQVGPFTVFGSPFFQGPHFLDFKHETHESQYSFYLKSII